MASQNRGLDQNEDMASDISENMAVNSSEDDPHRELENSLFSSLPEHVFDELVTALDNEDASMEAEDAGMIGILAYEDFVQSGESFSLDQAIDALQLAIDLQSEQSVEWKVAILVILGSCCFTRFNRIGDPDDITSAINAHQQAVNLTAEGNTNKARYLNNLAISLDLRFKHLGELVDIDKALATQQQAVDLTPDGHADKANRFKDLGSFYYSRFKGHGELVDFDKTIAAQKQAIDLTPDGHVDKAIYLSDLGDFYFNQYEQHGDLVDIDKAISAQQQAIDLTSDDQTMKARYLTNSGISFLRRFEALSELVDIDKAIAVQQQALDIIPAGDVNIMIACLNNLGISYRSRFHQFSGLADLDKAISHHQQVIDLTPEGHSDRAIYLSNLGSTFYSRFNHLGDVLDIDKAIGFQQQAVDLTPDDHANKAECLIKLGNSFYSRFKHLGDVHDIEKAIACQQQAVDLTPDGHASKIRHLYNLGNSFSCRFEQLGKLIDIDKSIAIHQQVIDLTPDSYAHKAVHLNTLGVSFRIRFERLGELSDIDQAIAMQQQSIDLTLHDNANKAGYLNNLGTSFYCRFERLGNLSDIDQAIDMLQQSISVTSKGHPNLGGCLNNLGIAFRSRFKHLGKLIDIDRSIATQQQAVDLTPDGYADKAERLNSLGNSFYSRFKHLGDIHDIERAIAYQQQAVNLTPDGHANKAGYLKNLGISFSHRYEHLGENTDIDKAITAYRSAVKNDSSHPSIRYDAAHLYASLTAVNPSTAIEACQMLLELIPQCVWLGQKITHRYDELIKTSGHVNAVAAIAISTGDLALAIEWLEQGRNIVWGQILQLRTPIDELYDKHPMLADMFTSVCSVLTNAGTDSLYNAHSKTSQTTMEEEAQAHHSAAIEYKKLLDSIRQLEGFNNFLQPKKITELVGASKNGPVIVINVHGSRSDALVLHCYNPLEPIIHVPLEDFSSEQADILFTQMNSILMTHNVRYSRKLIAVDIQNNAQSLQTILATLWLRVVEPIMLKIKSILVDASYGGLPHITWCATGHLAFLPLHAAGIYGSGDPSKQMNISDFVVSSYTPTLTALLHPPIKVPVSQPKILLVSQPNTPHQRSLPGTIDEVNVIQKCTLAQHTLHLDHKQATVSNVLKAMDEYHWVHLACHGIQDIKDPIKSAFALYDGRLDLQLLMTKSLNQAELAFLSACQTATGDEKLPEEAVHLAAGMLTAGFPAVIGTMWSIGDADAPVIAETFYLSLLRENGISERKNGHSRTAYALHEAVKKLREKVGDESFINWVPFVHFGI
ncbi:hypothetical protein M422DRAFT_241376 [Sphaerobolus stellatus SS14]|nr:hypothetical protein M422DRAFT_241376 [Sphaerobolus stellatus SS14]